MGDEGRLCEKAGRKREAGGCSPASSRVIGVGGGASRPTMVVPDWNKAESRKRARLCSMEKEEGVQFGALASEAGCLFIGRVAMSVRNSELQIFFD